MSWKSEDRIKISYEFLVLSFELELTKNYFHFITPSLIAYSLKHIANLKPNT